MKRTFTIYGTPVAKARPRIGRYGSAYTPTRTKNFEYEIRFMYMQLFEEAEHFENTPLKLTLWCYFEPSETEKKSKKKYESLINNSYTKKPDIDNITKAVLDALNGFAYDDDKYIVDLEVHKRYGKESKVVIEVTDEIEN